MAKKNLQMKLLKDEPKAYGGELLKTREGRSRGRPIDTKRTLHLVLRSSKAIGDQSFWRPKNKEKIRQIVRNLSVKFGVKVISMANVGNHLHFHLKISSRYTYPPFIRGLTASIAMAVTGTSRWKPFGERTSKRGVSYGKVKDYFWDYRPFTRVVMGLRDYLNIRDYIEINRLESYGYQRPQAKFFLKWNEIRISSDPPKKVASL